MRYTCSALSSVYHLDFIYIIYNYIYTYIYNYYSYKFISIITLIWFMIGARINTTLEDTFKALSPLLALLLLPFSLSSVSLENSNRGMEILFYFFQMWLVLHIKSLCHNLLFVFDFMNNTWTLYKLKRFSFFHNETHCYRLLVHPFKKYTMPIWHKWQHTPHTVLCFFHSIIHLGLLSCQQLLLQCFWPACSLSSPCCNIFVIASPQHRNSLPLSIFLLYSFI